MINLDKIVKYLEKYKGQLEELYKWEPRYDRLLKLNVINTSALSKLNSKINSFQKEELLKDILSKELQNRPIYSEEFKELALWIIRDWGGIYGGSDLETMKLVKAFIGTEKPAFDRIASTSKVGGFMYPERNIIYDSRVSYSVNWIILSQNAGDKYFPIPEGRNTKMGAFDMNVLIRLKYINEYKTNAGKQNKNHISEIDKRLYVAKENAYQEMNKLITEVNKVLWSDYKKNQPFYTEMLLFSLADTIVFEEITSTVSLKMNVK